MKRLNELMRKVKIDVLVIYITLIIIAGLATFVSSYVVKQVKVGESPAPTATQIPLTEKPSTYPDYDAIKGKNPDPKIKVVRFTDGCLENGCVSDIPASQAFDGIRKNYSVKGRISRAYLYIEAAVDYGRPLTIYDDFYFALNYNGGHLLLGENLLPIPPGDISRYLYDLRSISYFYKGRSYKNVDFLSLIQNVTGFNIHVSISSDRPGRTLKEVSFYYQCTETSDCAISEISDK